jgi:hypothetical protein
MISEMVETFTPGINREGAIQCKHFPYCLCWA